VCVIAAIFSGRGDFEITDAESTLTRAQQAYLNSIHD
jgi:hypothetical protein